MKPDNAATPAQADCFHQETDALVVILENTKSAILAAYRASKSWRDLARKCAVNHNVLYALAQEDWSGVGWETVRLVRSRLNLDDPGPLAYTLGCPTCGIVHAAGDCHGLPVTAVVCLAPGEVVAAAPKPQSPQRPRKHYRRPCFDDDPAICLDQVAIFRGQVEAELIRKRLEAGRGGVRVGEDANE